MLHLSRDWVRQLESRTKMDGCRMRNCRTRIGYPPYCTVGRMRDAVGDSLGCVLGDVFRQIVRSIKVLSKQPLFLGGGVQKRTTPEA
jgi:hypothetical protein